MKFLNLGCGSNRPPYLLNRENNKLKVPVEKSPWVNLDSLRSVLLEGTKERENLDSEENYFDCDLSKGIPLTGDTYDGILASHLFEHLDLQQMLFLVSECYRVLKVGGILRVLVPCPKKFYQLTVEGCTDWGETNPHNDKTFMEWALFFFEHKQLITEEALNCVFLHFKFSSYSVVSPGQSSLPGLADLDNREKFSLIMEAIK